MKNLKMISIATTIICCAFATPSPKKMFLMGDSISLQYGAYLGKLMAGQFSISRKDGKDIAMKNLDVPEGSNIGDSRMALSYIQVKFSNKDFKPDVVLLNCGLHDIKRDPKTDSIAVFPDEYRKNLEAICGIMKKRKIPMVWISSTPVVDSIHQKNKGFKRYAADIEQYNAIADDVMKKAGFSEIDLFTFTKQLGGNRYVDHVHYNEETRALHAAYIAGFMSSWATKHFASGK